MRILLINQFYVPDTAATGQLLADVAEEWAKEGHDVQVICSRKLYRGGGEALPKSECIRGVQIHRVGGTGFGRRRLLGRVADYLSFYLLGMWRAIRLPRPELCMCLTTPPLIGLLGMMLSKLRRARFGVWVMDVYPEIAVTFGVLHPGSMLHGAVTRCSRKIYASSEFVISIGDRMTQRLVEAGCAAHKITTIHHWAPGDNVTATPMQSSDEIKCVYSGNLGVGHDLATLLEAMAQLPPARRPHLLLTGHGAMKDALEKQVQEHGLSDLVEFRSPVSLDVLSEHLAAADFHIVSQKPGTEGLLVPSKIYGILAAGRPVLFLGPVDCEIADLLRDSQAGLAIHGGDLDRIAHALTTLSGDAELRADMGERARQYYETRLGMRRNIDAITRAAIR